MSKNLLKSYYVNRNTEGTKVIDTNDMIAQKLERIKMVLPEVKLDDFYEVNLAQGNSTADPLDVLTAEFVEEDFSENIIKAQSEPVYTGPSPEELVAEAMTEIEAMKQQAMAEMQAERENVLQQAYSEGYEEGKRQGLHECETFREQIEQERVLMQEDYARRIEELEPQFIRTLTGIYEKVFEVGLDNQQEIIMTLLRNTMKKLDGTRNFLVHVNSKDYGYVKGHKDELVTESTPKGVVIDIVEDSMVPENECMIETANGIYDCGIGTQLEGLRKKLILLSYEGQQES